MPRRSPRMATPRLGGPGRSSETTKRQQTRSYLRLHSSCNSVRLGEVLAEMHRSVSVPVAAGAAPHPPLRAILAPPTASNRRHDLVRSQGPCGGD